jgi:Spherulation-specific family 4
MSPRPRIIAALAALAVATSTAVTATNHVASAQSRPTVSLAVPAYFTDDASWDRVLNTPEVRYVVGHPATPAAGKAYVTDKALAEHLAQAKAKGITTLIYVTAGYDKIGWQTVADRIDSAFTAYPNADGVFIDEINYNQCEKYTSLSKGVGSVTGVRTRHPNKLVILNPGAPMLNCYDGLADGYLNLERAQADVPAWETNVNLPANAPYYAWMFTEANRSHIWQMVHSVSPSQIGAAVDGALSRNASVLFVTPDALPNPYDTLPDDATWKAILDRVDAYNNAKLVLPAVKGPKLAPVTTTTKKPAVKKSPKKKK